MRSVVDPARPTLRLVHREGDPAGVVAVAVFTTGGSRGALLLGHLARHRLAALKKWQPRLRVHGIGFVLAAEARSTKDGQVLLEALQDLLAAPVLSGEVAAAGLPALLRDAAGPLGGPSLVGSCGGEFGAEGGAAFAPERAPSRLELEELRQASVRAGRVGLSALGEPALLDRVAHAHRAKWPKGGGPLERWPAEDQIAVRQSGGVFELRVAVRVLDQARALIAGRALRRADHPALVRLRALDRSLEAGAVSVTLRPLGACLALTVVREGPLPPTHETMAAAALVLEQELLRALRDAPLEDPSLLAVLAPESAIEAASLAAWTAVAEEGSDTPTRTFLELVAPEVAALDTAEFSALLRRTEAMLEKRQIPMVSRTEDGQPESWLLLGTPCGTAPESPSDAGLRALALRSAARAWDGADGVRLEPWIEAKAMGMVAHAAPRRDESPEQMGERLAWAAVRALALGDIDGATIASARADQLMELGSDPGRDLLVRALSGDHPSALDPRGLERELAALSALDVERARHALGREPLRAAYVASMSTAEITAARGEISRLLAPQRSDVLPCPMAGPRAAAPGAWSVSSVDPGVTPGAFVGVPVATSAPTGRALEFLLNRPGGYLDRGLFTPGIAEAAHAHFFPGAFGDALIIELRAAEKDLDRAIAQARGLLAALRAEVPAADARLARGEESSRRALTQRSPRGRAVELWLGRLPPPPTPADLRALAAQLGAPEHRVVKVQVRTE